MAESKGLNDLFKDMTRNILWPPLMYGCGYTEKEMKRPRIGIANTWNELNPGHVHLRKISEKVKEGIKHSGMTPFEFNTIAPCDAMGEAHEGMRYILPAREIIAASVEIMARVNSLDGMVLIGSCDKIVPGLLMAAARIDLPAILIPGGYAPPYCFQGPPFSAEKEFAFPEIGKFIGAQMRGELSEEELQKLVKEIITGPGACPELGTAMTMQCMAEALGMSLPYTSVLPAMSERQLIYAFEAGKALALLIEKDITPSKIMTRDAFKNAVTVLLAIGGSTNGILHLPAIANEMNIELSLDFFDYLSGQTPQICTLKPNGPRAIKALDEAGGIPGVMKNLSRLLSLETINVTGKTFGQTLEEAVRPDPEIIRSLENPASPDGGLAVMRGNLSPQGSIVKKSAVPEKLRTFRGPAKIFEREEDAIGAMFNQEIKSGECIVIRNEGPKGGPGMREMSTSGHMMHMLNLGETSAMITDGRFSGTNYGLLVGHISPEASAGGPLAVLRDGDMIEIDIPNKSLRVDLSPKELKERLSGWQKPGRKYQKGILAWYSENVTSADKGAIIITKD